MPYNLELADQLKRILIALPNLDEKKMFGGTCFLLNGNMLCGVYKDFLIVRLGKMGYEQASAEPHTRPFDITGKPMSGWLMVDREGWIEEKSLRAWVDRALEFVSALPAK